MIDLMPRPAAPDAPALRPVASPIDALESEAVEIEYLIGRLRSRQLVLLAGLESARVAAGDGCRSMQEWTAARFDVEPQTARKLVAAARQVPECGRVAAALANGEMTFDRAAVTARLAAAGAGSHEVERSAGYDLAGVRRLATRRRRITRRDEQDVTRGRHLTAGFSLDGLNADIWGRLPAADCRRLFDFLDHRADQLPESPEGESRGARRLDALLTLVTESATANDSAAGPPPTVTVFVDVALTAATRGEAGGQIAARGSDHNCWNRCCATARSA